MKIFLLAALAALAAAPAFAENSDPACVFDGDCRPAAAAPAVSNDDAFLAEGRKDLEKMAALSKSAEAGRGSVWSGTKRGVEEGATLGFMGVISPAAGLMSEGFSRRMSRAYDGARGDNDGGALYYYGGAVLGVVLYIPALVAGAVGAVLGAPAGAAAEAVSPGSTESWDAERWLFDGPRKS